MGDANPATISRLLDSEWAATNSRHLRKRFRRAALPARIASSSSTPGIDSSPEDTPDSR
jgi:hypothetical protein